MKRLQKYAPLLAAVQAADPRTRVGILRSAPDEFIKTLLEVVLNFLAGNIEHSSNTFKRLQRHKATLRSMKKTDSPRTVRSKIINSKQKGGFLPLLLAPLLAGGIATAVAAPAISKAVARKATNAALDSVENRVKGYIKKL